MVDDFLHNGMEQILMLCDEQKDNVGIDPSLKPLVTLVKGLVLSSISWSCSNSSKLSINNTTNHPEYMDNNNLIGVNSIKRQRIDNENNSICMSWDRNDNKNNKNNSKNTMNNKNDFLANSSNRSIQMDSISNALVSRLASVEKKYKMCLSSMHTKEYSIRVLKNEIYNCICDDSDDISSNQNNNILEQAVNDNADSVLPYTIRGKKIGKSKKKKSLHILSSRHDKYDVRNGILSIYIVLKNQSDQDIHDASLSIVYNDKDDNNDIRALSKTFMRNKKQITLSSKSTFFELIKANEVVEFVSHAHISNIDVNSNVSDVYRNVAQYRPNQISVVASFKIHNNDDDGSIYSWNDDNHLRIFFVPLYSFNLLSTINQNKTMSIIAIDSFIYKKKLKHFYDLQQSQNSNANTIILRLLLVSNYSYTNISNIKNVTTGIKESLHNLGWRYFDNCDKDDYNTNTKTNTIKFRIIDRFTYAILDVYSGDSTWSSSHGLNLNTFISAIQNAMPSTLKVVPTIFTKVSLRIIGDVLNAVLDEKQKSSQLNHKTMDNNENIVGSMMQAQCRTDLLVGRLLNSLSIQKSNYV